MGEVDIPGIRRSCETRSLHIRKLKNLADEIDLLHLKFNSDKIKGNGASLFGGSLTVISGTLTVLATGGAAIPILGVVGTAVGVAGGLWNFTGADKKSKKEKEILQMIKDLVEEDNVLQEKIRTEISKFETLDDTKRTIVGEQILTIMRGYGSVALAFGPQAAMGALAAALVPMAPLFTGIPVVMAFLGVVAQGGQAWLTQGALEMADEGVRNAVEKAAKHVPDTWTKKTIIENAYGNIINRGGKQFVQLTEEGAKALADEAATAIAAETARLAKIVGGITIGLGAISCVWDAYQITEAWDGSKKGATTKLGEALRRIASQLNRSRTRG